MTQELITPSPPGEHLIKVDTEHFWIRFLVPVIAIGSAVLVYIAGVSTLDRSQIGFNPACLMLPVSVLALFAAGFGGERVLKRLMPSRRYARLSDEALVLVDGRKRETPQVVRLEWGKIVNVVAWRFTVRRRTRVPKGWHCLAVQLLQDDLEMILYTFMSPEDAEKLPGYSNFVRLRPRRETESNTDLRAVAEQRRLLKLEDARWHDGAEISADDFRAILARFEHAVPGWKIR